MTRTRRPEERKIEILDAALRLAHTYGYQHVTREQVACLAKCAPGSVSRIWGTMPQFRRAIMSAAIARKDLTIIAQGLVAGDPKAHRVDRDTQLIALGGVL